ncbi:MAG: DUF3575 domain-containing protein [Alistipes sp.]|nr:DUF3575 domain-containing protein [Alistipes sp.]
MIRRLYILVALVIICSFTALSQDVVCDSVVVLFRTGGGRIDLKFNQNDKALETLRTIKRSDNADYRYFLRRADIYGTASPEGSIAINNRLSKLRAESLSKQVAEYLAIPDSIIVRHFVGRDWRRLRVLASLDSRVPSQQAVVNLLDIIAAEAESGKPHKGDPLHRLQSIANGKAYSYLARHHFSKLRAARLCITYNRVGKLPVQSTSSTVVPVNSRTMMVTPPLYVAKPVQPATDMALTGGRKPFYMALKTNLLADLAITPNIGIEFYLGRGFSISAMWNYAWWRSDSSKWYWRTYGGDLSIRKYLGKAAKEKPLTGHHLGIYGQALTYDFVFGSDGRGEMCDTWSYAAGIEYGYSLPIHRRLNLDFVIGVGYLGGLYKEYVVKDDCYVWEATKRRQWFGPTKAEISLVWLIGRGNYNQMKGKRR